jgi:hypothetical protein
MSLHLVDELAIHGGVDDPLVAINKNGTDAPLTFGNLQDPWQRMLRISDNSRRSVRSSSRFSIVADP